ncbi:MAG: RNase P modulator RnpM [Eubacteriales bacterium]
MREKKVPMRRCVGCNISKPKGELIRISAYEGKISIDNTGKAKGRGIYLCRDEECFEKARKRKAISRNLEVNVGEDELNRIFGELRKYERKD